MSSLFQGLTDSQGRVFLQVEDTAVRPAGTVDFRGMAVTPDGSVLAVVDTGQPRNFIGGVAFDAGTGMLLLGSAPAANEVPGGLSVTATGAVISSDLADVIHQGVGLKNDGSLITSGGTSPKADRYVHPSGTWVGKSPVYSTIGAALTASVTDDVIEVSGGPDGIDYAEYVQISTQVHLRGSLEKGHNGWATISGTGTHCLLFRINGCVVSNMRVADAPIGNAAVISNTTITDFTLNDCLIENNGYHTRTVNSTMATSYIFNRCRFDRARQSVVFAASALNLFQFNFCQFRGENQGPSINNLGKGDFRNCTFFTSVAELIESTGGSLTFENCLFIGCDSAGSTGTFVAGGANCTCTQCMAFGSILQTAPSGLLTDESVIDGGNNLSGVAAYLPVGQIYSTYLFPAITYAMLDDTENTAYWSTLCGIIAQYGWKMGLGVSGNPTSTQYDTMVARIEDGTGYIVGHSHTATDLSGPGPIQLSYTGAGAATVDVTNTGDDLDSSTWGGTLVLKVDAGAVATFDLTDASYDTVVELIASINAVSGWNAQKPASNEVSDFLESLVMLAVTGQSITSSFSTMAYNRDRLHTVEIGDQIDKVEAAFLARGLTYDIDTFYPHGNLFDSSTQDYCESIGLVGMRTFRTGDKDVRNYNVYQSAALSPVQACGTVSDEIVRNTAGLAETLNGLGWCVGLFSHTETIYNAQQWAGVFEELSKHGVTVLTFSDAMKHVRGDLTGILPPASTVDGQTFTREMSPGVPVLSPSSVAGPDNVVPGPSYGDYDVNMKPTRGRTFVGAHGP